jgi:phage terminase large subunit
MQSLVDSRKSELYEGLLSLIDNCFGGDCYDFGRYQKDPVAFGQKILGETYTDGIRRLMESVRDNPITIAQSANATGKTHGAARVAVWFYKCFPGSQVYTAAAPPEGNLKRLLWGEITSLTEKHPDLFQGDEVLTLNVSRDAQSFISGVTIPSSGSETVREAKFAGKHAPYLLFILDEGDAVPDEVYKGIESCMSGGHARLLVMFNPRGEQGAVYRLIRDGRAKVVRLSAFDHPNVTEGRDIIPGAVTRETTVRRINEWCRSLAELERPGEGCFELPLFLEGATARSQSGQLYPPLRSGWYKIEQPEFSYMVLGEWPAQGSTKLISREWIAKARGRWDTYVCKHGEKPPEFSSTVAGLDVGEFGMDSNVLCFRSGGYVERLLAWSGVDPLITADRAAAHAKQRSCRRVNVDATGVGAGVAPQLQRVGCPCNPVKVASSPTQRTALGEFQILRDQLWWAAREWLRTDQGAMLPPDEQLLEELLTPTYEVHAGRIRIMRKDTMRELLKRSPDRADALCLTFAPGGFFDGCDLT